MKKDKITLMKELKKEKIKIPKLKDGLKLGLGLIGLGLGLKYLKENL